MRLTVLLVTVIGCASCQGSVPIHSGENGNEEREPTPVIALEAERERTAPSPNLVRLPPNAFTDLATDVIANLERRGCTIPQVWLRAERSNVVRGRFTSLDQTAIAVLCSVERVSSILVFRGSSTSDIVESDPKPDRFNLEGTGDGIGFSRMIGVAAPEFIRDHYEAYGGREPLP